MMVSSALVSSTISLMETLSPSNLSHNFSCDTVSIAALTLTCVPSWYECLVEHIVTFSIRYTDVLGIFEAKPLYWALAMN